MKTQQHVAVTLAPLGAATPAMEWISAAGVRGAQLSVAQPGLRPRDLDASGRRDLRAVFRRLELVCSGIDAWIPPEHWLDGATVDRAMDAMRDACALAEALDRAPISLVLPGPCSDAVREARRRDALAAVVHVASVHGIALADAAWSTGAAVPDAPHPPVGACIDPAAILASGRRVLDVVTGAAGRVQAARIVDLLRTGLRGPVGEPDGQLNVVEYRAALDIVDFKAMPVIDARQWLDPRAGVLRSLASWSAADASRA